MFFFLLVYTLMQTIFHSRENYQPINFCSTVQNPGSVTEQALERALLCGYLHQDELWSYSPNSLSMIYYFPQKFGSHFVRKNAVL